jgi:hypothetical protein
VSARIKKYDDHSYSKVLSWVNITILVWIMLLKNNCVPLPLGMDFYVVLERPGYRVARRRRMKNRVGVQHKVTKEDAIKW